MDNTCDVCSKTFKTSSYRDRHKKLVHAEVKIKYKCWICEKLYYRKDILKGYSITVHGTEEMVYEQIRCTRPQAEPVPRWIPPPEAGPAFPLVHGPDRRLSPSIPDPRFKAITIEEALREMERQNSLPKPSNNTTLDLQSSDLNISPAVSDTLITSTKTNCQDENGQG